jgi:hypothetical protein
MSPLTNPDDRIKYHHHESRSNIIIYTRSNVIIYTQLNRDRYLLVGLGGFVHNFWNLAMIISINPPLQIHKYDRSNPHPHIRLYGFVGEGLWNRSRIILKSKSNPPSPTNRKILDSVITKVSKRTVY